jgi:hypothetical protein
MQSTEQAKAEARGERLEARVGREERTQCRMQSAKCKMRSGVGIEDVRSGRERTERT